MGEFAFQTLRESITSAIRSKILTGELQPGVKLAEQKLAEEFGSSRAHPGALRQLEQEAWSSIRAMWLLGAPGEAGGRLRDLSAAGKSGNDGAALF